MHWITDLFPFIPQHVVVLGFALVLLWVLFRWGDCIFLLLSLWAFWHQQLTETVWYFIFAMFFGWAKAWVMLFERAAGYRGPWV